jgi:hypothetical protein
MYHRQVTNGDIIAYAGRVFLVGTMDHGTILHVYTISHLYIMHITANNGIEPDTAFIAHGHFPYDCCIRREKAPCSKNRLLAGKRQNCCHNIIFKVKILLFG